jgi:OmpA-OmpF porin, OOP family
MKKVYLSAALLACSVSFLSAQRAAVVQPAKADTANSLVVPVSHWSVALKGGSNYFRVADCAQTYSDLFHMVGGASVEYDVNPFIGFGAEYMYNPYGRPFSINKVPGTLEGSTHDAVLFSSLNLSNLLTPVRRGFWSSLSIYGEAGVGLGFYNYDVNDGAYVSKDNFTAPMAKLGLNAEYSLNRSLALNVEGQYRYYSEENMGSHLTPSDVSDALALTIGLRYKIGATKKQHARNINAYQYYPELKSVNEKVKSYQASITKNEQTVQMMAKKQEALQAQIAQLTEKQLKDKALNDSLQKKQDLRLDKLETKPAAPKVVSNDPLLKKLSALEEQLKDLEKLGKVSMSLQNINFVSGKATINPNSYAVLEQVVSALKSTDKWKTLIITGHTDNVGKPITNRTLSEERAFAVKDFFVSKGIDGSKIRCAGKGADEPVASNKTAAGKAQNRRVQFEFSK